MGRTFTRIIEKLFSRFHRLGGYRNINTGGLRAWFTVLKNIIELHEGKYGLDSYKII
jgi:signal transduction histidine kinase